MAPTEEENLKSAQEQLEKPWANGEPYYCATCAAPKDEFAECVNPGPHCKLETKQDALARRARHLLVNGD